METPNRLYTDIAGLVDRLTDLANQQSKEQRIQIIADLMKEFELTITDIGEIAREFVDRRHHAK
jgi:hypothetical protein